MTTRFYQAPDNVAVATLGYAAGSGQLLLQSGGGARFGTPTEAAPVAFSTFLADGTPQGIFAATGRTGDLLTGLNLLAGPDATLPAGSLVQVRWTGEHAAQIASAVNAIEADYLTSATPLGRVLFAQTADATVANTTAVSSLLGTGIGSATLDAGFLTIGKTLRLRARGAFNSIASPGTLNFQVFLGSTRIAVTSAITLPASQTARYWDAEFDLTCRAVGASGSVFCAGKAFVSTTASLASSLAAATIDTTAALALDLRAGFSVADPGNSITCSLLEIATDN